MPALLTNPRQSEEVASSRTGVCYCMGLCPECGKKMVIAPILRPIAYTVCCHAPRTIGDEVASCPHSECSMHQKGLCLNGRSGCGYSKIKSSPRCFSVPVDEMLSEYLSLASPTVKVALESDRALEIIHEAVLASDEASLVGELQGCTVGSQMDARYEVLAPLPPRLACNPIRGALQRSTGRRALLRLKKLVGAAKPSHSGSPPAVSGTKRKRPSETLDPDSSGPLKPRVATGGLKRQFSELSANHYRDPCSEKYRVKVHRLSFGISDKTTTPDYDQLVKNMSSGSLEVPQSSHPIARSKGKGMGKKGKSQWVPRLRGPQCSSQGQ